MIAHTSLYVYFQDSSSIFRLSLYVQKYVLIFDFVLQGSLFRDYDDDKLRSVDVRNVYADVLLSRQNHVYQL